MPPSTTHQRCRSANVIAISCDLSPSSATKMTAKLNSTAANTRDSLFCVAAARRKSDPPADTRFGVYGRRSRPPALTPVQVTGLCGVTAAPVCRLPDWGLLPFAVSHATHTCQHVQLDAGEIASRTINLSYRQE